MHSRIRRHIGCGFAPGEWEQLATAHPVARLYQQGERDQGDRLLREYTVIHEAGHGIVARLTGFEVERVVVAHLHEVDGREDGALGFTEYGARRSRHPGLLGDLLVTLGGVAGHEALYANGWGLDAAAWTPAGGTAQLRDEASVGGDLFEARRLVFQEIRAGRRVLGEATTADALLAGFENAEALLLGNRGRLLALAGHLLAYGRAERADIDAIWSRGE